MSGVHVVLLAGGSGSRVGAETPKQFLPLGDKPVLAHSLEVFLNWERLAGLVLVARPDLLSRTEVLAQEYLYRYDLDIPLQAVAGGATRHGSTLNGVGAAQEQAGEDDLIFIHDAARPFIVESELEDLAQALWNSPDYEIASLASSVTETVVEAEFLPGVMGKRLERSRVFAVKTPQAVRVKALDILTALPEDDSFTDLLSWGLGANLPGYLVEAGASNQKLTTAEDYEIMRIVYEARGPQVS